MVNFRTDILPLKDALFRLALRILQSREEAEDVVQETMLKVWARREQWNNIENIEAFTMTICRNLSLDHLKRLDNQHASLDDETFSLMEGTGNNITPFDHVVSQNRIELVQQIINSLPEKQRSCVQLRDIEGKPYKDIANILNISEEQVKVNIFRARQTIRQRFQQMEDFKGKEQ
ncbi:MAG: RNA polymerase sigma factor [Prevotella sp.]|nr:RNA polymerase sigma factor [Prevotella sp.]